MEECDIFCKKAVSVKILFTKLCTKINKYQKLQIKKECLGFLELHKKKYPTGTIKLVSLIFIPEIINDAQDKFNLLYKKYISKNMAF